MEYSAKFDWDWPIAFSCDLDLKGRFMAFAPKARLKRASCASDVIIDKAGKFSSILFTKEALCVKK